jgi:hypothetical protein
MMEELKEKMKNCLKNGSYKNYGKFDDKNGEDFDYVLRLYNWIGIKPDMKQLGINKMILTKFTKYYNSGNIFKSNDIQFYSQFYDNPKFARL